jgi:hexosaminidase
MDPTFNPTLKATYTFFNTFFREMSRLFPDEYIHIGGDENSGKQWDANKQIQAFKRKHKIKDNHALQAYFNKKILKILTKYGKKMVGWDEIFQPDLPKTIVIHSWRGKKALNEAAKKGYFSILSNGYYIDLVKPAQFHYLNDPIPENSHLSPSEKRLILGGEATMWSELVSPETVDSRIWPRTAAIAERLWSPGHIKDVLDMYHRLHLTSLQLEELGLTHIKNQDMMLRRLSRSRHIIPLKVLVEVIEPVKIYKRHAQGVTYTSFSPLTRVVDAALPDARRARIFGLHVQILLKNKKNQSEKKLKQLKKIYHLLEEDLKLWLENHSKLKPLIEKTPALKEIEPLSEHLSHLAKIGLKSLHYIMLNEQGPSEWIAKSKLRLEEARKPKGHAELMIVEAIGQLLDRCISQKK